jgi:hypothetical protein
MAYLTMLSGFGLTTAGAPFGNRCFFDGRVLALSVAVPLILAATGLLAGAAAGEIALVAIGAFLSHIAMMLGGGMDSNNRWSGDSLSCSSAWLPCYSAGSFPSSRFPHILLLALVSRFMFMFALLFAVPVFRSLWSKFGVDYDDRTEVSHTLRGSARLHEDAEATVELTAMPCLCAFLCSTPIW